MSLIRITDLSFSYQNTKSVLKNINLEIEEGKFTCIIGENGSGKSTLLKCILGLNKGYSGKIVTEQRVGYLPQRTEVQANFPASIEEVVLSGTIANNIKSIFYKKEDKQKANQIMKDFGIYDIRKKSFSSLSGGQQQRVLIARAMCATEKLIILDEPTNGLDPVIAKQTYEMLHKLKQENNLTVVMVSHDLDRAVKYADYIVEMADGKVIYNGTISEYLGGDQ